ncbi:MAG TPA: hypothetical protein VHW23_15920 [Kofleriaceae bacterium]|nr:hypothetical protein [Kofleriaceae bacterium]
MALAVLAAAPAACVPFGAEATPDGIEDVEPDATVELGKLVAVEPPAGTLQNSVIELASSADLTTAVIGRGSVFFHVASEHAWYFESGNYLLGVEQFVQFHQELDRFIDFGVQDKVAPGKARVVGHSFRGQGWNIPAATGQWPAAINSVWVIGTDSGQFGMGGAPQGIPMGTEVFGSMQTYGGVLSTPFLEFDDSPNHDSSRIRAGFAFNADTLLGGHSAGASAARRIGLDLGLGHVWLYGTPNYSRGSGAFVKTETSGSHTMHAEVINNHDDPVTNSLANPFTLVSLAWGTAKCHSYTGWDYQKTSPVTVICP